MSKYDKSIEKIFEIEINDILKVKKNLNLDLMARIIDLLLDVEEAGHKVVTAGCGTSGILARRVAHSLCVVGVPAAFLAPGDSIHGGLGLVQKEDIVILFSKGGDTEEIIKYIPCCKAKGTIIIGVSQNDDSVLAREADIYFPIVCEHESDPFDMCASASCNTIAVVWDAIVFTVMRHNGCTKDELELIHAGGKVGQILKNRDAGVENG